MLSLFGFAKWSTWRRPLSDLGLHKHAPPHRIPSSILFQPRPTSWRAHHAVTTLAWSRLQDYSSPLAMGPYDKQARPQDTCTVPLQLAYFLEYVGKMYVTKFTYQKRRSCQTWHRIVLPRSVEGWWWTRRPTCPRRPAAPSALMPTGWRDGTPPLQHSQFIKR